MEGLRILQPLTFEGTGFAMLLATIEKTIPSPTAEVASHRT